MDEVIGIGVTQAEAVGILLIPGTATGQTRAADRIPDTIAEEAKPIIVQRLLDIATYGVCDPKILREILPPSHILASCGLGGRVDLDIRNCFVQRELRSIRNFASQEQKKLRQACMAPGQARMEAMPS